MAKHQKFFMIIKESFLTSLLLLSQLDTIRLRVDLDTLPAQLKINAWTEDDSGNFNEIMGIYHEKYDLHGVQFHPESIESEFGHQLIQNFLNLKK